MYVRHPADLGSIIRERRRFLEWSQSRLALTSGVSRQWVVALEKGEAAVPLHLLIKVLDELGLVLRVFDDTPARLAISRRGGSGPDLSPRAPIAGLRSEAASSIDASARPSGTQQAQSSRSATDRVSSLAYEPTDFEAFGAVSKARLYEPDYRAVI